MKNVVPFHRGESSFEASARAEYVDIDMAWTMRVFESLCWLQKGRIFHFLQLGLAQARVQNPMSPCQLVALRVLVVRQSMTACHPLISTIFLARDENLGPG
ncbi:hypothetical protein I7I53_05761 [Histoplasma capsulatum var. duboisii H88]|nr:hypothetical protein I7I53_05761 [Histoplasma capsulatum var. duboisii H88]